MTYSQIAWLPLTCGLALIGFILSWLAWRRRGIAAGLRGVAWSLLPLAAYLIGAIELLWRFGTAIGDFASSFVFSPRVWSGVIVFGVAVVLFVVSGSLRRRRGKRPAEQPQPGAVTRGPAAATRGGVDGGGKPASLPAGKRKAPPPDEDMAEIEAILRRRGIK
jgi:hypothetical protein